MLFLPLTDLWSPVSGLIFFQQGLVQKPLSCEIPGLKDWGYIALVILNVNRPYPEVY